METISDNGTLTRMMSYFKNCDHIVGRLCPDWETNGMRDKLRVKGSYLDGTSRTSLKFSFIKCVNSTSNANHCKSPERIEDFMGNTIIEMRIDDSTINDEFSMHMHEQPLVQNEDLVQTFQLGLNSYQLVQQFFLHNTLIFKKSRFNPFEVYNYIYFLTLGDKEYM